MGWIGLPQGMPGGSQVSQIYPQAPPPSYSQVQMQGYVMPVDSSPYNQYGQYVGQHPMVVPMVHQQQAQSISSGSGSHRSGSTQRSGPQKENDRETVRSSGSSERSANSRLDKPDDKDRVSIRDDVSIVSGSEVGRDLASVPSSISGSRQSFRMAMVNPMNEFFVDVM